MAEETKTVEIQTEFGNFTIRDVPINMSEEELREIKSSEIEKETENLRRQTLESFGLSDDDINRDLERSGVINALLSGLSNDEAYKLAWLAKKRFPEMEDPASLYFIDEDGEFSYIDPETFKPKKEFRDGAFNDMLFGAAELVGPTAQFLAETIPGTVALTAGTFRTGSPLAGGVAAGTATAIGGGTAYALRQGISEAFDGPPLNVAKAKNDLTSSSLFGSIPFGAGVSQSAGDIFKAVTGKFPDGDGRRILQDIIAEGGSDAESKIKYAKDKYDVILTKAEAEGIVGNAALLQKYLQMQGGSQKIWDFYHDRALQVEEQANVFFDEILGGKYLDDARRAKLSGVQTLDPEMDLAEAADRVLRRLAKERQERANPMYAAAYDLDVDVDISGVANAVKAKLDNPNISKTTKTAYKAIYDSLLDKTKPILDEGKIVGYELRSDTKLIHDALREGFGDVIDTLSLPKRARLKREISILRQDLSKQLKDANPLFKEATEVYDMTTGHLQILERTIINDLAKAVEKGGEQAARLTQRLFNGNITPQKVTELKKLITDEDPQVWQNILGHWLRTQFDEAIAATDNVLGVPNRFLSRIGMRGRVFTGRGAQATRGKKARVFEAALDKDEFDNFKDLVELMQATSYVATKSGSPTQPFLAMQRAMEAVAGGRQSYAVSLMRSMIELPSRLVARGFDDAAKATLALQKENFEDRIIQALIDPKMAEQLKKEIEAVKPIVYFGVQAAATGSSALLENLASESDKYNERNKELIRSETGLQIQERARDAYKVMEERDRAREEREKSRLESSINSIQMTPIDFESSPQINPALSPTLLPNPQDREIAMRRQGIGGLA